MTEHDAIPAVFERTAPPSADEAELAHEGRDVSFWWNTAARAGLTRSKPMRRRVPLKPGQKRLRTKNRNNVPDSVRRRVLARSGGACERCGMTLPLELHHKVKRSQGGGHTDDNLAALCHACHRFVEAHPARASAEGWSVQKGKVA